jgi:hypothetical protein
MRQQAKKPNTYAFIDSQNLNLGIQRMGWKMDWRKFRQFLDSKYGVTKAYMFIGYLAENESLYEHMHELGYLVVLKPTVDMMTNSRMQNQAITRLRVMKNQPRIDHRLRVTSMPIWFSMP